MFRKLCDRLIKFIRCVTYIYKFCDPRCLLPGMGSSSPPCLEPASTSIFDLHLCTCPPAASDPMGSSAGERSDANLRRGFPGSLGAVVEELLPGQVCGSTRRRRGLPWWEGLFGCAARRIDCSESGGPERSLRR
jgi:hypothetical protein